MAKHFVVAVILGLIGLFGYLLYYTGYFKEVQIEVIGAQELYLAGIFHQGPYHHLAQKITTIENFFISRGISSCVESFGVYFDDPRVTEWERLRSFGGCIVTQDLDVMGIKKLLAEDRRFSELSQDFHIWKWSSP
ncbi:MAG: hypothetical protein NZ480_01320, partial [Bdellovibrionaceae bacterium]|nr:hypothetical protein [Pseudobdellovibrionaceae bacterium]